MSYIRANEFTPQKETMDYVFRNAKALGYDEETTEEYLSSFDRDFLRKFYEKAKAEDPDSTITKDLDAFINGHAYGYSTRFCLLRYR